HEYVLEAVQRRLDEQPDKMQRVGRGGDPRHLPRRTHAAAYRQALGREAYPLGRLLPFPTSGPRGSSIQSAAAPASSTRRGEAWPSSLPWRAWRAFSPYGVSDEDRDCAALSDERRLPRLRARP